MIRSRARTGTADAPCFQRVISLFSLCYLLLEKLSKFLIPLSDCPFVLNCLPVFLGKSPCFREKTGKVIYRRHPQYDSHAAAAAFSRVQRNTVPRASRARLIEAAKNNRYGHRDVARLNPIEINNARTHSKKQLKQIARSIERFGFVNPVLISDDFEIIAGHGRVEAAKILGLTQVPTVRLSNLSPADRRAYVITDNRLAELAGWDRQLLASELQGLLELEFDDIELTGFSLGEIDLMWSHRARSSSFS